MMSHSWKTLRLVTPKRLASVVAGAGGLVCAQTAYLQSTYVPLPRPSGGATHGVELWQESNVDQHALFSEEQSLVERLRSSREVPTRRRNVLIIGDSLVVGIGCKEAPVMPQIICKRLANLLQVDVSWKALGVNGGDVRTIHKNVLETVKKFQSEQGDAIEDAVTATPHTSNRSEHDGVSIARTRSMSEAGLSKQPQVKVDAVVVLCGLNDLKRIFMGRTSRVFQQDLHNFITDLKAQVGEECIIFLPAIPLEETRLPEPLKTAAVRLSQIFDEEKKFMATQQPWIHFIPKPAIEIWRKAKERCGEIVAGDGVHPNEEGYKVFAEYIGQEMAQLFRKLDPGADANRQTAPLQRMISSVINAHQEIRQVEVR